MFVRPGLEASLSIRRQMHSLPGSSTRVAPSPKRHMSSHKVNPQQEHSTVSPFNLWAQIREARPAVRYTVYAGIVLMSVAESTFYFTIIKAKYFPSKSVQEKEKADRFLHDLAAVMKGYRAVWLKNYRAYYAAYIWGLGYGGLNELDH
jgi:hypothetical protein